MILAILAIMQVVTRTPNDQIGIARALLGSEPTSAQIGSARGYEGLSARLPIPTMDEQAGGPGRMLCMADAESECTLLPPVA